VVKGELGRGVSEQYTDLELHHHLPLQQLQVPFHHQLKKKGEKWSNIYHFKADINSNN